MILYKNREVEVKNRDQERKNNNVVLEVQIKGTSETIRVRLRELIFFKKRQYEKNK